MNLFWFTGTNRLKYKNLFLRLEADVQVNSTSANLTPTHTQKLVLLSLQGRASPLL